MLFVGKGLTRRVAAFREYNVPEPVTGGLALPLRSGCVSSLLADGGTHNRGDFVSPGIRVRSQERS